MAFAQPLEQHSNQYEPRPPPASPTHHKLQEPVMVQQGKEETDRSFYSNNPTYSSGLHPVLGSQGNLCYS